MDQIVSAHPGLIPQMSGLLTRPRIWGCTTVWYHVSDFVYVHLIQHFTVEETLLDVKDFEKTLAQSNCPVTHYHADNVIFVTFFVLCMCLIAERKAQEALARQSGSHNAVHVST